MSAWLEHSHLGWWDMEIKVAIYDRLRTCLRIGADMSSPIFAFQNIPLLRDGIEPIILLPCEGLTEATALVSQLKPDFSVRCKLAVTLSLLLCFCYQIVLENESGKYLLRTISNCVSFLTFCNWHQHKLNDQYKFFTHSTLLLLYLIFCFSNCVWHEVHQTSLHFPSTVLPIWKVNAWFMH